MLLRIKFLANLTLVFLAIALIVSPVANAQHEIDLKGGSSPGLITSVPRTMTYQGILKDGDGNPIQNESKDIIFRIYDDATAGELEWDETIQITTDDGGYFTATLSNVEIPFDEDYWLELEVDSEILSPRQKLNMVAYAAVSDTADYARTASGGGWVDDGPSVRLETLSDKVGIGISSPGNRLHVVGSESVPILNVVQNGSFRAARFYSQNACALWVENAGNHGLRITNAGGRGVYVQNAGSDGIRIDNAGGWAGYFNGTGYFAANVGIGTETPTEMLDVAGTVQATGIKMPTGASNGYVLTSDGSGVGTWQEAADGGSNWTVNDLVLYTNDNWGIARGNAENMLWGDGAYTMVNLGVACTTGTSGLDLYYATVSGGYRNRADNSYATVGGGMRNTASGSNSTVGGGWGNEANGDYSTVGGGGPNEANGYVNTVGGGIYNIANGYVSTIGGGESNTARNFCSTVGAGYGNEANGDYSTVGGGSYNTASGQSSTVPGGTDNTAAGEYSFAAGRRAKANHHGTFVWADQTDANFASTGDNQFLIRASGGVGIGTTSPDYKLDVEGSVGIDIGSNFNDTPFTIDVPANQAGLISRVAKGGSIINVVDSDGNVGIGTTNPEYPLDVSGTGRFNAGIFENNINGFSEILDLRNPNSGDAAATVLTISADADVGATAIGKLGSGNNSWLGYGNPGESFIYTGSIGRALNIVVSDNTNGKINFYVGTSAEGTPRMVINNNGNVGIGTTGPTYKLDVLGSVGVDIGSNFNDTPFTIDVPANQAGLISRIAKGGSLINVVDSDGHVGIGTFSPQGALDVSSTTGAFIVPRMTTAQRNALTAVNGMIVYNTTANQFNFYENGAWVTK